MAWGYEKCFIIEHDNTLKRRIDCKDCCNYESEDKSCMKRPLYLPVDGYNSWRTCNYFELDSSTSHYEVKNAQYTNVLRRKSNEIKKNNSSIQKMKKNKNNSVTKSQRQQVLASKAIVNTKRSNYQICMTKPNDKKLKYEYVEIITVTGAKRKIQVGFDDITKIAFINKKVYTQEAIECVRKILK